MTAHLWQSTFFAIAVGLLAAAFRRNRAQVRYWLWLSASIKFLIPFALLMSLGRYIPTWAPATQQIAAPAVSLAEEYIPLPSPESEAPDIPEINRKTNPLPALWLCGLLAVAVIRLRTWVRISAAVRASSPVNISAAAQVRSSPGLLEPGVVGLFRPTLLLPAGITERLTPSELKAVIAHELCHVQRRDNLFAAIHMMVEAIFWFHPLVWWIGARLVEERERACDEEVLSQGNHPDIYADAILNVCKFYAESPLPCVSGVSGASIRKRIEAIMANRQLPRLNHAKKLLLASASAVALAGPIVIGLAVGIGDAPSIHAQTQPPTPPITETAPKAAVQPAKPQPAPRPKFDVVSIKPCSPGDNVPTVPGGRGGGESGTASVSPGKLRIGCMKLPFLIEIAYVGNANNPLINNSGNNEVVRGAPAWARSESYSIEAETDDPVANGPTTTSRTPTAKRLMMGPMIQSLLEDRFRLKIHREIEEVPTYALTVAKGGLKLKPMAEGACQPQRDGPLTPLLPGDKPWCNAVIGGWKGPNRTRDASGVKLVTAVPALDRPVVDHTGIADLFEIHLEYAPDEATPGRGGAPPRVDQNSDIPAGATIFTALEQQLGLKLVPDKGPRGYIVIDSVEHPSEN